VVRVRLIPAEQLEPYLEEAFPSTFEERLALSRKVVRRLDLPFPEALLEPLLEKASRPACFYGMARVGGQSLVLLRLGNAAALAEACTHGSFPESWETFPTFSAFSLCIRERYLVDLGLLGWEEATRGLARALKAWAEARGLRFPDRPFSALPRYLLGPFVASSGLHVLWAAHEWWSGEGKWGDLVLFSPYWALVVQSEGEAAKLASPLCLELLKAGSELKSEERAEEDFLDHLPGFLASRGFPPDGVLRALRGEIPPVLALLAAG
jgi:hypothetical protein